ncbi:MAG: acyltransferase, partial [Myxococcales bacterium]|nr:acyltransferase [Myxococcales bacterium]
MEHRADIEGLRAVAVLLVVLFHARLGVTGGFVGVDVFFALSGYLITTLLVREHERSGRIDLLRFYGRRVRRLLPASFAVVVTVLAVGSRVLAPDEQRDLARTAQSVALYASNLRFAWEAGDYFGDLESNALLHTWSLGVEEQFYVLWPLALVLALRVRQTVPFVQATVLLGLPAAAWAVGTNASWAFFLSPLRAWELALGALGALWAPTRLAWMRGTAWSVAGALAVVLPGFLYTGDTPFPGVAALPATLGTTVLLVAGAGSVGPVQQALSIGPLRLLGRLSYAWYLWHWPVLVLLPVWLLREPTSIEVLAGLGLSLLLAWASFHVVEQPLRGHARLQPTGASLALGALLTAAGVGLSFVALDHADTLSATPELRELVKARATKPRLYRQGCNADHEDITFDARRCTTGEPDAPRVVLFGDSHAAQWAPPLRKLAERGEIRLTTLTKSSCRPIGEARRLAVIGREYTECAVWFENVLEALPGLRPAVVLVGGRVLGPTEEAWRAGLSRVVETSRAAGAQTVFLEGVPVLPGDVSPCLARSVVRGLDPADCHFVP